MSRRRNVGMTLRVLANHLMLLVGAQGLEPWTR